MAIKRKIDPFFWITVFSTGTVVVFILFPLIEMVFQPSVQDLKDAIYDPDVLGSIWLSIYTSGMAALISFLIGTPFAYLLARKDFFGKKLVESIIDLPIMIPHPVVGIAILGLAGKNHWLGHLMQQLGIQIMGTVTGIVTVLTFVGLPFYTFRLAWRSMLVGIIMCSARAISEFGAVVIVAYHPMIAPVMIYERFTAYGIKYSQPVAVWLIVVSLLLFLLLRICSLPKENQK
jgi:molybdate/tungstate transport system permease protein